MDIETERQDNLAVVRVRGEMDVQDAYRVPETIASLFDGTGTPPTTVALDLSEVSFIDSVGLGMLVRSDEEVRHSGASMQVRSPSHSVRRLLSITAMTQILTVVD